MTKPKIVCVIGSAMLAPLTLVAVGLGMGLLVWALGLHFELPDWLRWTITAISALVCITSIWSLYTWYFNKCYQPPAGQMSGPS